jgi:hypothetical protein
VAISKLWSEKSLFFHLKMLSREASITKIKALGLTQPGIEPTTFHTQGEHQTDGRMHGDKPVYKTYPFFILRGGI